MVTEILENREELLSELEALEIVKRVYPTDSNFYLVKMKDAKQVYLKLIEKQVILRDRSKVVLCEDGIRITIGTKEENKKLIEELKKLSN
jgi:histidinol-phosphate aminotransferase